MDWLWLCMLAHVLALGKHRQSYSDISVTCPILKDCLALPFCSSSVPAAVGTVTPF